MSTPQTTWQPFSTAPRDRDIFATARKVKTGGAEEQRFCGQLLRWSAQHQEWMQCVHGRWYVRPFFTPTHWADIRRAALPAPMFQ